MTCERKESAKSCKNDQKTHKTREKRTDNASPLKSAQRASFTTSLVAPLPKRRFSKSGKSTCRCASQHCAPTHSPSLFHTSPHHWSLRACFGFGQHAQKRAGLCWPLAFHLANPPILGTWPPPCVVPSRTTRQHGLCDVWLCRHNAEETPHSTPPSLQMRAATLSTNNPAVPRPPALELAKDVPFLKATEETCSVFCSIRKSTVRSHAATPDCPHACPLLWRQLSSPQCLLCDPWRHTTCSSSASPEKLWWSWCVDQSCSRETITSDSGGRTANCWSPSF